MSIKINVGSVEITPHKMEKLKNSNDVSDALTVWERIKKFFHFDNIEEKEKVLCLIKDIFLIKN